MKEVDIVEFARKNGAFRDYFPDNLQYVGEVIHEFNDITFHELMFLDMFGFVDTWSFKINNHTGKILPYEGGVKFMLSGFNPDEMRKKLEMIDKAKAAREIRTA